MKKDTDAMAPQQDIPNEIIIEEDEVNVGKEDVNVATDKMIINVEDTMDETEGATDIRMEETSRMKPKKLGIKEIVWEVKRRNREA